MTPVQIMKAVLKCLADERTLKPSYFMERGTEAGEPPPPPPMNFRGSAEVIFVEPSGWLNIAAHLSKAALIQVGSMLISCYLQEMVKQGLARRAGSEFAIIRGGALASTNPPLERVKVWPTLCLPDEWRWTDEKLSRALCII